MSKEKVVKKAVKKAVKQHEKVSAKKVTRTAKNKTPVDVLDKYFEKGNPTEIEIFNVVRPDVLKRLVTFVMDGTILEDIAKSTTAKLKSSAKGTSDFRKYSYFLSVTKEVMQVRDLAKKGDETARMKLCNWRFITKEIAPHAKKNKG